MIRKEICKIDPQASRENTENINDYKFEIECAVYIYFANVIGLENLFIKSRTLISSKRWSNNNLINKNKDRILCFIFSS